MEKLIRPYELGLRRKIDKIVSESFLPKTEEKLSDWKKSHQEIGAQIKLGSELSGV